MNKKNSKSSKIPYTVLVLKDVVIYKSDDDVSHRIVKNKLFIWASIISLFLNDISFLLDSVSHALNGYSIFSNEMLPVSLSDPGDMVLNYYRFPIQISKESLEKDKLIFDTFSSKNDIDKKISKSIEWLGKSKLTISIEDSVLYIAIALECLLSFNESSLISPSKTNSFAEGVAFLIGNSLEERLRIYQDLKKLYGKRSAIVHSGDSSVTNEMKERFFEYVVRCVNKILELKNKNIYNINDLRKYIENKKFN